MSDKALSWTKTLHSGPIGLQGIVRQLVKEDVLQGGGPFYIHVGEINLPGGVNIHFRLDHGSGSLVFEAYGLSRVPLGIADVDLGHKDQMENHEGHVYIRLERV